MIDEGYGGNEEVLLSMSYADSFYPSENTPEVILMYSLKMLYRKKKVVG